MAPLASEIQKLLVNLLRTTPENFIAPRTWMKHRDTLRSYVELEAEVVLRSYQRVNERNERLANIPLSPSAVPLSPSAAPLNSSALASRPRQLLRYVDNLDALAASRAFPRRCLDILPDRDRVIVELLKWATSPFRHGSARVYLVVALIRKWRREGVNTDEIILEYLVMCETRPCSGLELYLLLSELIVSKSFSIMRYMQWLIARGTLFRYSELKAVSPPTS